MCVGISTSVGDDNFQKEGGGDVCTQQFYSFRDSEFNVYELFDITLRVHWVCLVLALDVCGLRG